MIGLMSDLNLDITLKGSEQPSYRCDVSIWVRWYLFIRHKLHPWTVEVRDKLEGEVLLAGS